MMRTSYPWLLLLLMALTGFGCTPYRIPSADGSVSTPSPPSLEGTLVTVSAQDLLVRPVASSAVQVLPTRVAITPQTAFFTDFGGYLQATDIPAGKTVKVWFTHKKAPTPPAIPVAAVVEVAQ